MREIEMPPKTIYFVMETLYNRDTNKIIYTYVRGVYFSKARACKHVQYLTQCERKKIGDDPIITNNDPKYGLIGAAFSNENKGGIMIVYRIEEQKNEVQEKASTDSEFIFDPWPYELKIAEEII